MNTVQERIVHYFDPSNVSHIPLFLPWISRGGGNDDDDDHDDDDDNNNNNNDDHEDINVNEHDNRRRRRRLRRPFTKSDLDRVMDYKNMPEPPTSCSVMHCEGAPGSGIDNDDDDEVLEVYDGGIVFPKRCAKLVGGYIFLSSSKHCTGATAGGKNGDTPNDAKNTTQTSKDEEKSKNDDCGKIACIPLQGSLVELPPGGRRVFREHAHTGARKGYEMAIHVRHSLASSSSFTNNKNEGNTKGSVEGAKLTCYIVLDTLGRRESWASAIRIRCDLGNSKITLLRPGGIAGSRLMNIVENDGYPYYTDPGSNGALTTNGIIRHPPLGNTKKNQRGLMRLNNSSSETNTRPMPVSSGNADLDAAIERFGIHGFKEETWLHEFLKQHSVLELQGECDKLERWIDVIKEGMRGAVLEQYEYFVEASREMSTMGREVAWIRSLVERQQETLMSMRNIDFGNGFEDMENGGILGEDREVGLHDAEEDDVLDGDEDDGISDASSVASSTSEEVSGPMMSSRTPMRTNIRQSRRREAQQRASSGMYTTSLDDGDGPHNLSSGVPSRVEIPPWIADVCEDISAFIKESRYTDAAELILKGKAEVMGLLAANEQPTPPIVTTPASSSYSNLRSAVSSGNISSSNPTTGGDVAASSSRKVLSKKHQAVLQKTNAQLDALLERLSSRLAENLRRKNEALKASAKRERADPLSTLTSLASPVCLNDDAVALRLLVKLGKYQEAATAYAARRSLLLSECLHERPISSPIGMDAVIYAAQISSSFFSSLAIAVEGFLDLFIDSNIDGTGNDDDTSLNSRSIGLGSGGKRVPSGALSAIVLWCDSELVKFTNAFGSSRLLGSLALSPPGIRRPANLQGSTSSLAKEREHSIEVAAKCIDQAFAYASENLDSIGLSITPKLAENMRPKLKGCEAEVAAFLDVRWKSVAFGWLEQEATWSSFESGSRPVVDDRRV